MFQNLVRAFGLPMFLVIVGIAIYPASADGPESGPETSSRVHAFYYPWYQNLETDGNWSHWNHAVSVREGEPFSYEPPEQIGANFYPAMGLYSSRSREDLAEHMKQLRRAGVGVIATSWWGPGDFTDEVVPQLLDVADEYGLKVAFHLEPIAGRNDARAEPFRDAIVYLVDHYGEHPAFYRDAARDNKPLFYFYDSYLVEPADWAGLFAPDGSRTLRGTKYDGLFIGLYVKEHDDEALVKAGFDGFYTYFASDGFTYGSTTANWPAIKAFANEHQLLFIPSVAPGYDDTRIRPWNTVNQRDREEGAYYDRMWEAALAVDPPYVSITSFNEWHEGTQIEPAVPKTTPTYTYLDYTPREPEYYLERTAQWVGRYVSARPDAVSFAMHEGSMEILVDGARVAIYVWQDETIPRPYFCNVIAPDGTQVTRNHPPDPVADADNDDHPDFHPGIWLAFGDITGQDFWRNRARVRHAEFTHEPERGEGVGRFSVRNVYESNDGEVECEERCDYAFHVTPLGYLLTAQSTFTPVGGAFAFGDQEEMGFGVRVATPISVRHGEGVLANSEGGRNEAGTWGKAADWCAGLARINGAWTGMCVMTDPGNFRPSWFHSRDYGLIVANPFGRKAMTGPDDADLEPDQTRVEAGETLRLGFGVYIFSAAGEDEPDMASLYAEYLRLATQ